MKTLMLIVFILGKLSPKSQIKDESPVLYYGTTFGEYFQMLHKLGDYESMLRVTSQSTIKQFGQKRLLAFYQEMEFSYPLKLKAHQGNILYYFTTILATKKTIQIVYSIEHGKVKIVFDKLNPKSPFVGI